MFIIIKELIILTLADGLGGSYTGAVGRGTELAVAVEREARDLDIMDRVFLSRVSSLR